MAAALRPAAAERTPPRDRRGATASPTGLLGPPSRIGGNGGRGVDPTRRHALTCASHVETEASCSCSTRRRVRVRGLGLLVRVRSRPRTSSRPWASSAELGAGALRLSLGWTSTDAEVDHRPAGHPPAVAAPGWIPPGFGRMRVLVAMSGSRLLGGRRPALAEGHDVVGVTLKLWGGESDHRLLLGERRRRRPPRRPAARHRPPRVPSPKSSTARRRPVRRRPPGGVTPNPCVECNRHLKFDGLLRRALALGYDAVATGHHARVVTRADGTRRLAGAPMPPRTRATSSACWARRNCPRCCPMGELTKAEVRAEATPSGCARPRSPTARRCASSPPRGGGGFLVRRSTLAGRVVDNEGGGVGAAPAVELVTVGQRRGLGLSGRCAPLRGRRRRCRRDRPRRLT